MPGRALEEFAFCANTAAVASARWAFAMKYLPLLAMPVPATAFTIAPCHAVEIQNFHFGLMCDIDAKFATRDGPIRWICFETEIRHVTGQGRCIYDGRMEKGTWYGYEFDYSFASEENEITCVSMSPVPINFGTPESLGAKDVTVHEWSHPLLPDNGHCFNFQFARSPASTDQEAHEIETVCSIDGRELFRFTSTRFTRGCPVTYREKPVQHWQKAEEERGKKD